MTNNITIKDVEEALKYKGRFFFQQGYFYLNRKRSASWILMWCDDSKKNWVVGPLTQRGSAHCYLKKTDAVKYIIELCNLDHPPRDLIDPNSIGVTQTYVSLKETFEKERKTKVEDKQISRMAQLQIHSLTQDLAELKARLTTVENQMSNMIRK